MAISSSFHRRPGNGLRYSTSAPQVMWSVSIAVQVEVVAGLPAHQRGAHDRPRCREPDHLVVHQLAVRAAHQDPPEPQLVVPLVVGEVVDPGPAVAEVERGDGRRRRRGVASSSVQPSRFSGLHQRRLEAGRAHETPARARRRGTRGPARARGTGGSRRPAPGWACRSPRIAPGRAGRRARAAAGTAPRPAPGRWLRRRATAPAALPRPAPGGLGEHRHAGADGLPRRPRESPARAPR